MKAYLHIGIEKTGSSYLQSYCFAHRTFLHKQGIYYPGDSKWDKEMAAKRISPGNGAEFSQLIDERNWVRAREWLGSKKLQAKELDCDSILLSNEIMFSILSESEVFSNFVKILKDLYLRPFILLIVRNPVNHAMSLFKHRSKYGRMPDLNNWLDHVYDTPLRLNNLLLLLDREGVSYNVRKYSKSGEKLLNILFIDWLGISIPETEFNQIVNPSLTLSELHLLQEVRKVKPNLVHDLYMRLLALPINEKSDDFELEHSYEKIVSSALSKYELEWKHVNSKLMENELLEIPKVELNSTILYEVNYSKKQLVIITRNLIASSSVQSRLRVKLRKLRNSLAILKWRIKNSRK